MTDEQPQIAIKRNSRDALFASLHQRLHLSSSQSSNYDEDEATKIVFHAVFSRKAKRKKFANTSPDVNCDFEDHRLPKTKCLLLLTFCLLAPDDELGI